MLEMAKARYKEWLQPEKLILIQGWKRDGLTDEQVAHNMGIAPRTLEYWKKDHIQILQALKIGKEQANFLIENELFKKARKGNVTAMIFWLKNNWRDKYNDSQLSMEERQAIKAKMRKLDADTQLAEAKARLAEFEVQIREEEFNTDGDEARTDNLASAVTMGLEEIFDDEVEA